MKKLLVVVDYQNDFVIGSLGFPEARAIEANIIKYIENFLYDKHEICFTKDIHDNNYLSTIEGKNLPVEHCLKDTRGINIYGKVAAYEKKGQVFYKDTFGSIMLMDYLRQNLFDEIALVGVVSNICVLTNALLAKTIYPDKRIIVYREATASNDPILEQEGFNIMRNLHIEVI